MIAKQQHYLIAINLVVSMKFTDLTERCCNFLTDRLVILAQLKEVKSIVLSILVELDKEIVLPLNQKRPYYFGFNCGQIFKRRIDINTIGVFSVITNKSKGIETK